jgi:hypothetical protein
MRRLIALTIGAIALIAGAAQATALAVAPSAHPGQAPAAATSAHTGAAPAAAPSAAVSLSGWNLTVPIDSSGGNSGDAMTVSPARLYSPYLTQDSSGALDFWAPSNGARLGISLHARTELRGPGTFTLGQGSAGLSETTKVTRLPDNSHDIIIGQMFPTGTTPFAGRRYHSSRSYSAGRPEAKQRRSRHLAASASWNCGTQRTVGTLAPAP